jgi:hypothetical protein
LRPPEQTPPTENRQPGKKRLFLFVQQLVVPGQGGFHAAMTGRGGLRRGRQESEHIFQLRQNFRRAEQTIAGGGQFQRQRQAI